MDKLHYVRDDARKHYQLQPVSGRQNIGIRKRAHHFLLQREHAFAYITSGYGLKMKIDQQLYTQTRSIRFALIIIILIIIAINLFRTLDSARVTGVYV